MDRLQAGANALMNAIQRNNNFNYNDIVRPDDRRYCSRPLCHERETNSSKFKTCAQCRYAAYTTHQMMMMMYERTMMVTGWQHIVASNVNDTIGIFIKMRVAIKLPILILIISLQATPVLPLLLQRNVDQTNAQVPQ
jgi:hypothetical protein